MSSRSSAIVPSFPKQASLDVVEVTLVTGRKAKIKELTGRQMLLAESCISPEQMQSQTHLMYYRAVASLQEFDGAPAMPISGKLDFDSWFDRLSGRELTDLANKYYEAFYLKPEETLGNESNASET